MLCMVRHQWQARVWFSFSCYNNWVQMLLLIMGKDPAIMLSREEVTQDDPLSNIIYGINLTPLA